MKLKINYPWGSPEDRDFMGELYMWRNIKNQALEKGWAFPDEPLDAPLISLIDTLHTKIYEHLESGTHPWILVLTDSVDVMNTCATVFPTSFALSTLRKHIISTNLDDMVRYIQAATPMKVADEEMYDPVGYFGLADLLIINDISTPSPFVVKYSGVFSNIFKQRSTRKYPMILTGFYEGMSDTKLLPTVSKTLTDFFGALPSALIVENSDRIFISLPRKPVTIQRIVL
jgi:hypothetical protein